MSISKRQFLIRLVNSIFQLRVFQVLSASSFFSVIFSKSISTSQTIPFSFWKPGELRSVSFVASATVDNANITIPSAAQSGDLAILYDRGQNDSGVIPTTVVPSNFTSVVNTTKSSATSIRMICSYKILNSSDPNTSITGMAAAGSQRKILAVFRPEGSHITTVEPSTPSGEITDGNPAAQSITMTAATPVILGVVVYGSGGTVNPRTATGATFSEVAGVTAQLYLKYCVFSKGDTPTDATVDIDDEGLNNGLQSFYLKLQ